MLGPPGVADQSIHHWRQVVLASAGPSVASRHGPSSTRTSTLEMPLVGAQATPAIATRPVLIVLPSRGVSIRD